MRNGLHSRRDFSQKLALSAGEPVAIEKRNIESIFLVFIIFVFIVSNVFQMEIRSFLVEANKEFEIADVSMWRLF